MAKGRSSWWPSIRKGTAPFETDRISQVEEKCEQWQGRLHHRPEGLTAVTHACPMCHRAFQAQIGLIGHR